MAEQMNITRVDYLFSADVELGNWGHYPRVGLGVRINSVVKGGEVFNASGLIGKVCAGGIVNQVLRYNGVFDLEGRLSFELEDGTMIYLPYAGRADFCTGEEFENFADGKLTGPVNTYMSIPLESTDPKYNRMYAYAVGRLDDAQNPGKLMLDIYEFESMPM